MPIKKPNELDFTNKPITMLIQGVPSIGKTTLALSSEKPLLIDLERGVDRVKANHRADTYVVESWQELMEGLRTTDLSEYKTIVVDTLGSAVDNYLTEYLKEMNPAFVQKDGKTLSLKGYGQVKLELKGLLNFVKSKNLNLIIVTHVKMEKDGEQIIYRPDIAGALKDEIFNDVDLACFYETIGNKRRISFAPTDRYMAKGNHGITGTLDIPDLSKGGENNFLQLLFKTYRKDMQAEVELNKKYDKVISEFTDKIVDITSNEDAIKLLEENEKYGDHIFTSKDVIRQSIINYCQAQLSMEISDCKNEKDLNEVYNKILSTPKEIALDTRTLGREISAKAKALNLAFNKETKSYEKVQDNTHAN